MINFETIEKKDLPEKYEEVHNLSNGFKFS